MNEGVNATSSATHTLEVSFPADAVIELKGGGFYCSGESGDISAHPEKTEEAIPVFWTATLLQAPEGGELQGITNNLSVARLGILDTLVNTGKTVAKVSYQLQAMSSGCLRSAGTVEVQVNPLARIEASLSDSFLCSGIPFSISLFPQSWGDAHM